MAEQEIGSLAAEMWTRIRAEARAIADEQIAIALRNLRPGGAHPFCWEIPSPVADALVPVAMVSILYPCIVTSVDLYAAPGETSAFVLVDLWVSRPGQTLSEATSIIGVATAIVMSGVDRINEKARARPDDEGDAWLAIFLEPGSVLMPVIKAANNVSSLTISVNVRAV
jgi:hypothetical protein